MNCLGKDNYVFFIGLLLSLASLLTYGVCLSYLVLNDTLQSESLRGLNGENPTKHWSAGRSWPLYFHSWGWAVTQDFRVGGVGLLAFMTAPLAWGMFLYHIYLIWAGMTINESSKWSDWKDDVDDGLVFKLEGSTGHTDGTCTNLDIEPVVDWPITSSQHLVKTEDGRPPISYEDRAADSLETSKTSPTHQQQRWRRLRGLNEVDNLYDLGFWDNLGDVLAVG